MPIQRINSTIAAVCLCMFVSRASAGEVVLAENGRSTYQIVVADDASPSTQHGAEELRSFLEQISGATLPIVSDRQPQTAHEIILGNNAHLQKLGVAIDFAALGEEGYVIRTAGEHLIIAGGPLRGNLYGVYGFLEDHLGCRWFTPEVSHIPKSVRLAIAPIDQRQVPAFEYREPLIYDCLDGQWCARNRMNSFFGRLEEKHGGKVVFADGFFSENFYYLVPPDEYFNEHPEYFAMVDGQRQKAESQLCCTNPDVIRICIEKTIDAMRAQPGATVFSVSQNDGTFLGCQCPACQELTRREDSEMGPVLQLVNRVAEAVEKEFPDKIVDTLAYEWTRKPPKHIRPRPNVQIRLCVSGPCCFSHPLATCDSEPSRAFRSDIEGWAKIAPRLWIWDYVADFGHFLLPYPNQPVFGPNARFFAAHNVKGVFAEGADNTPNSDFAALNGYLIAKLLWNPDYDADKAIREFLEAFYGKAAEPIRRYMDLLHERVERENIHVIDVTVCDSPHLADDLLMKADKLWQQAEAAVAGDSEVLQRVKFSRLSVDCAILERARLQAQQALPANKALMSLAVARFKSFAEVLQANPLTHLRLDEPLDKDAYCSQLAKDLGLEL
jgi:hypothetical protein